PTGRGSRCLPAPYPGRGLRGETGNGRPRTLGGAPGQGTAGNRARARAAPLMAEHPGRGRLRRRLRKARGTRLHRATQLVPQHRPQPGADVTVPRPHHRRAVPVHDPGQRHGRSAGRGARTTQGPDHGRAPTAQADHFATVWTLDPAGTYRTSQRGSVGLFETCAGRQLAEQEDPTVRLAGAMTAVTPLRPCVIAHVNAFEDTPAFGPRRNRTPAEQDRKRLTAPRADRSSQESPNPYIHPRAGASLTC